jgi:hypothetical protein
MIYNIPGTDGTLTQRATPFAFPFVPSATDTAQEAYQNVLAMAGALPWNRDAVDVRIFGNVANNTGAVIDAPSAAEWDAIVNAAAVSRPANWDTDNDGMPNGWEAAHGLDPNVADNNLVQPDGYTALEHYINSVGTVPEPGAGAMLLAIPLALRRRR